MTIDLSLDSRLFIRNELDAGVQELDLLLNTTNTELINYPQFGTDFEQFLWQLNPAPQERDVAPEADPNYNATVAVPEAVPDENAQPDVTQQ